MPGCQFSNFSGLGRGVSESFPDPYLDVASLHIPTDWSNVLYWSEHIYNRDGTYKRALERLHAYFITDVVFTKASSEEEEKWRALFDETLHLLEVIKQVNDDCSCYGNAFVSFVIPFKRFVTCKKCQKFTIRLAEAAEIPELKFQWGMPEPTLCCPICKLGSGYTGPFRIDDMPGDYERELRLKTWSPHQIEIRHDLFSGQNRYTWKIPEDYRRDIINGDIHTIDRAPKLVLQAVQNNQWFEFGPDAIFHLKEPTVSGINNRGWGLPRTFSDFRQIWHVQVLRRCNESIALDYVMPVRVVTPDMRTSSSGTDIYDTVDAANYRNEILGMLRQARRDPGAIKYLSFPVQYQMFGADARQILPIEQLDFNVRQMLNNAGAPQELYDGSIQWQAAPVALRLHEATNLHIVRGNDRFVRWVTMQSAEILSWEGIEASMRRVTVADNLEKQMLAAQLFMSQQLSGTTAYRDLGYNWRQEQTQIAEEAKTTAEIQARSQEEMDNDAFAQQFAKGQMDPAAAGGGMAPPGGGAAPAGGGAPAPMDPMTGQPLSLPVTNYLASMSTTTPVSPQELLSLADSIASELQMLPGSVRSSELRKLSQANELLHGAVNARLEQQRRESRRNATNVAIATGQAV